MEDGFPCTEVLMQVCAPSNAGALGKEIVRSCTGMNPKTSRLAEGSLFVVLSHAVDLVPETSRRVGAALAVSSKRRVRCMLPHGLQGGQCTSDWVLASASRVLEICAAG